MSGAASSEDADARYGTRWEVQSLPMVTTAAGERLRVACRSFVSNLFRAAAELRGEVEFCYQSTGGELSLHVGLYHDGAELNELSQLPVFPKGFIVSNPVCFNDTPDDWPTATGMCRQVNLVNTHPEEDNSPAALLNNHAGPCTLFVPRLEVLPDHLYELLDELRTCDDAALRLTAKPVEPLLSGDLPRLVALLRRQLTQDGVADETTLGLIDAMTRGRVMTLSFSIHSEVADERQRLASLALIAFGGSEAMMAGPDAPLIKSGSPSLNHWLAQLPFSFTPAEALDLMRLPFGKELRAVPGIACHASMPSFQYRAAAATREQPQIVLGSDAWSGKPVSLALNDLTMHTLVAGTNGSGKSYTTCSLLRQVADANLPFLVVEPVKGEYYSRLKSTYPKLRRWSFDASKSDETLRLDPMALLPGVTVQRHVGYLRGAFESAFPMDPTIALVLETALLRYYIDSRDRGGCGLSSQQHTKNFRIIGEETFTDPRDATRSHPKTWHLEPSYDHFVAYVEKVFLNDPALFDERSRFSCEVVPLFRRRFASMQHKCIRESASIIQEGVAQWLREEKRNLGEYSRESYPDSLRKMLDNPGILDLDALDDELKNLVMALILSFIRERRQVELDQELKTATEAHKPVLKHLLVIEEAHRLMPSSHSGGRGELAGESPQQRAASMFATSLAEMRATGQGILIVEQSPTKLIDDAVKNTNLKIMLRLSDATETEFLGRSMRMSAQQLEEALLITQPQAAVHHGRLASPLLTTIDSWTPCVSFAHHH